MLSKPAKSSKREAATLATSTVVEELCSNTISLAAALAPQIEILIRQLLELAKGDDGVISDAEAKELLQNVEKGIQAQYPDYKVKFPANSPQLIKAIKDSNCVLAGQLLAAPNSETLIEADSFSNTMVNAHGAILEASTSCNAVKPTIPGLENEKAITKGTVSLYCIGCATQSCSKYWVYFGSASNLKPNWYLKEQYISPDFKGKTWAIDAPYGLTGGNEKFFRSSSTETLGDYINVDQSKFFGNNPEQEGVRSGKRRYVNTDSQFLLKNENYFKTEQDLVNQILGDFIYCTGPENIVFPENGKFANILKKSIATGDIISRWASNDFNTSKTYFWGMDLRGEINVDVASGLTSLEHFMGSMAIRINNKDRNNVKFELFNITSFTSGYLTKDLPIIGSLVNSPNSIVRDSKKQAYSNISQYVSFTLTPSEINQVIRRFCTKSNCKTYYP